MSVVVETEPSHSKFEERDSVIVRFAGDSGDGMQLVGGQFTNTSAVFGNDISTFPDFPAEIRAPAGTTAGVSGFQIHFSSQDIKTPGDDLDALVVMNPAALKTNIKSLRKGGILIVNSNAFTATDLKKANYTANPLDGDGLRDYIVIKVPMTDLNRHAVGKGTLTTREIDRSKNFFALGLLYFIYDRSLDITIGYLQDKFGKKPEILAANIATLKAGYHFGDTIEALPNRYRVKKTADIPPGKYRQIMGNQALAYGLVSASKSSGKELFYASYPITPASDILHELSNLKRFHVKTFQAEDEIAAVGSAIGAAFGGALAVTGTSGPGLALKAEAIGLAVMTELPLVIVNVQRGGPSTGLPTKTEQADLLQAICGRNGESPVAVVAAAHPSDCFHMAREACRIAVSFMTPVIYLSDGYIANGAEPWLIPKQEELSKIDVQHPGQAGYHFTAVNYEQNGHTEFMPYQRDSRLVRPWALPGTPGLEHRIGGIEKEDVTGEICYEPENHEKMVRIRQQKIDNIADAIPLQTVAGPEKGKMLVLSWGGTYGAVSTAVSEMQKKGHAVAHAHLKYLNPFPKNLGELLKRYEKVMVAELNMGQLRMLIRAKFLVDALGYNKIQGQPFLVTELTEAMEKAVA